MSELNQLRRQFILDLKENRMTQLYTKKLGDKPAQYRYGDESAATELWLEGGYPTPEEAVLAWAKEQSIT
jgi:hypothetical protein